MLSNFLGSGFLASTLAGFLTDAAALFIDLGFTLAPLTLGVDFFTGATFLGAAFFATGLAAFFTGADFLIGLADFLGECLALATGFLATGFTAFLAAGLTVFFTAAFLAGAFEGGFFATVFAVFLLVAILLSFFNYVHF
ncbi:MAG TPA: hypothetical protein VMY77_13335 [Chitinophagaceae bacterium]|nr:hypothetical protein [Chitinophagaceae bacterium]